MGISGGLLAAFLSILLQFSHCKAQTFVYNFCTGANFTANSTYQDNLTNLLSSITNNISPSNTSFYETSVGRDPDRVYGLFQCRGDYSPQDCKSCATIAAKDIRTQCPNSKESIAWYDECLLQYSNRSFASKVQFYPSLCLYNENNISNPNVFRPKRTALMNRLVDDAVNSTNLFAVGLDSFEINQTVYGLVQCTQEISKSDCERCLTRAVSELPGCSDLQIGGRTIKPSCNVRYETYDFIQNKTALRTPAPPLPGNVLPPNRNTTGKDDDDDSSKKIIFIIVPIVVAVVILFIVGLCFYLRRKNGFQIVKDADEITTAESLQINFATVAAATDNFSDDNKLGEGGFGAVYKGKLPDGKDIAVKRLSTDSGQGVEEFKNEVLLLAKLQHRNLVRLLGFSLEGEEKLLIYEFVPNSSLDKFLFDPIKRPTLDWETRYKIIGGIARGLLYLHEDSRDTIIHRDMKASNVLLDSQMNPKISDFGLARLFAVDQTQGTTRRVVGTYGYMAPEYAMHGQFSVKTDVFSFGVLVLEIISGEQNNSSYVPERSEDLLSHAWKLWATETPLDLLDTTLGEQYSRSEVMRCIHMGLICVQEDVARRPTMASIVLMLNSHSVTLPLPSAPALFSYTASKKFDIESGELETDTSQTAPQGRSSVSIPPSVNEATMTELYPR